MGVSIRISAKIITWPNACACCLGRANRTYEAGHAKIKGRKNPRSDYRWWNVPYCSRCLDHIDAESKASHSPSGASFTLAVSVLAAICIAFFGCCCFGPLGATPDRNPRDAKPPDNGRYFAIVAGSLATAVGLLVCGYILHNRLDRVEKKETRRAWQRADSLLLPGCCGLTPAVEYRDWDGSVHDFWFANLEYAEAFVEANPGKILSL